MRSIQTCEHHNRSKICFSRDYIFFSKNFYFYDFLTIHGQPMTYHLGGMAKFGPFLADFSLKNSDFYCFLPYKNWWRNLADREAQSPKPKTQSPKPNEKLPAWQTEIGFQWILLPIMYYWKMIWFVGWVKLKLGFTHQLDFGLYMFFMQLAFGLHF